MWLLAHKTASSSHRSIFSSHHELRRDRQNFIHQVAGLWIVSYGCVNRLRPFQVTAIELRVCVGLWGGIEKGGESKIWVRVKDHSALIIWCDNPSCLFQWGKKETKMTHSSSACSWTLLNPRKSLICTLIPHFIDAGRVFTISHTVLHSRRSELGLV